MKICAMRDAWYSQSSRLSCRMHSASIHMYRKPSFQATMMESWNVFESSSQGIPSFSVSMFVESSLIMGLRPQQWLKDTYGALIPRLSTTLARLFEMFRTRVGSSDSVGTAQYSCSSEQVCSHSLIFRMDAYDEVSRIRFFPSATRALSHG